MCRTLNSSGQSKILRISFKKCRKLGYTRSTFNHLSHSWRRLDKLLIYRQLYPQTAQEKKRKSDSISATRGLEFPYLLPTCSSKLSVITIKRVSRPPEFPEIDNFLGENGTAATNCFLEMPFNCLLL